MAEGVRWFEWISMCHWRTGALPMTPASARRFPPLNYSASVALPWFSFPISVAPRARLILLFP